jgi:HNH endonuclease
MGAKRHDGRIVDHINGNRLDDRKTNLRFVTAAENSANVKGWAGNGFRGVYPDKGKLAAAAKVGGRKRHLGTYDTPEEAAQVAHLWRLENLPGYTGRDIAA